MKLFCVVCVKTFSVICAAELILVHVHCVTSKILLYSSFHESVVIVVKS